MESLRELIESSTVLVAAQGRQLLDKLGVAFTEQEAWLRITDSPAYFEQLTKQSITVGLAKMRGQTSEPEGLLQVSTIIELQATEKIQTLPLEEILNSNYASGLHVRITAPIESIEITSSMQNARRENVNIELKDCSIENVILQGPVGSSYGVVFKSCPITTLECRIADFVFEGDVAAPSSITHLVSRDQSRELATLILSHVTVRVVSLELLPSATARTLIRNFHLDPSVQDMVTFIGDDRATQKCVHNTYNYLLEHPQLQSDRDAAGLYLDYFRSREKWLSRFLYWLHGAYTSWWRPAMFTILFFSVNALLIYSVNGDMGKSIWWTINPLKLFEKFVFAQMGPRLPFCWQKAAVTVVSPLMIFCFFSAATAIKRLYGFPKQLWK